MLDDGTWAPFALAKPHHQVGVEEGHVQADRGHVADSRGARVHVYLGLLPSLRPGYFIFVKIVINPALVVAHARCGRYRLAKERARGFG